MSCEKYTVHIDIILPLNIDFMFVGCIHESKRIPMQFSSILLKLLESTIYSKCMVICVLVRMRRRNMNFTQREHFFHIFLLLCVHIMDCFHTRSTHSIDTYHTRLRIISSRFFHFVEKDNSKWNVHGKQTQIHKIK